MFSIKFFSIIISFLLKYLNKKNDFSQFCIVTHISALDFVVLRSKPYWLLYFINENNKILNVCYNGLKGPPIKNVFSLYKIQVICIRSRLLFSFLARLTIVYECKQQLYLKAVRYYFYKNSSYFSLCARETRDIVYLVRRIALRRPTGRLVMVSERGRTRATLIHLIGRQVYSSCCLQGSAALQDMIAVEMLRSSACNIIDFTEGRTHLENFEKRTRGMLAKTCKAEIHGSRVELVHETFANFMQTGVYRCNSRVT